MARRIVAACMCEGCDKHEGSCWETHEGSPGNKCDACIPVCDECRCPTFAHIVNGNRYTNHALYIHGTQTPANTTFAQYRDTVQEAYGDLRGVTFTIA